MANYDEKEDGEEKEGKKGGNKIMVILLLLIIIGGVAAAYFLLLAPDGAEKSAKQTDGSLRERANIIGQQKDVTRLTNPIFTPPREYNINLRDGKHYLRIEIQAVVEDPKVLVYLSQREPIINDMVITLLGNMTTQTLRTIAGRELFKKEIWKKINSLFTQDFIDQSETGDVTPVKSVLVTKFILQ